MEILIADDESLIRLDLKQMLEKLGHRVVAEAADGEQALALARERKPELAILDIRMPKADGIDVAARLSEEQICPVVLLTAFSDAEYAKRAAEAGVYGYLTKPFAEADLVPALQVAVARHEQTQVLRREVTRLEETIEVRKLVDRAKGILMQHERISEPEAFRRIQKTAMDSRKTMKEIAEAVIIAFETVRR